MRRKLMPFRLKWKRPCDKVPEHKREVLVRLRGQDGRIITMIYDAKQDIWYQPGSGKIRESGGYSTHEIFAWSLLPLFGALPLTDECRN